MSRLVVMDWAELQRCLWSGHDHTFKVRYTS